MRTVHQYDEENGRHLYERLSPESLSYEETHEIVSIESNGQTVFTLQHVPLLPHLSELVLNGVRARYGTDYLIDGSVLEWTSSIDLEITDSLTIDYMRAT